MKLSPAQRRALRALHDLACGGVAHAPFRPSLSGAEMSYGSRTVQALIREGALVHVTRGPLSGRTSTEGSNPIDRCVVLTDAGRAAIGVTARAA